ncbi:hypothetical protein SS50377_27880 [Spironucleus salmonicida]|uniref:Uncharacterized protein n=1 Tax=Spironucleus salmonicida TaxID=348837 RepID=V6LW63_9EUKA|nr:hypothetical protein SS50377_27880 [Spironucleus salmonicida]|eukprot:EST48805.1 Hypothetical protein SS50377_10900 [Spironucleus salmonicida]
MLKSAKSQRPPSSASQKTLKIFITTAPKILIRASAFGQLSTFIKSNGIETDQLVLKSNIIDIHFAQFPQLQQFLDLAHGVKLSISSVTPAISFQFSTPFSSIENIITSLFTPLSIPFHSFFYSQTCYVLVDQHIIGKAFLRIRTLFKDAICEGTVDWEAAFE